MAELSRNQINQLIRTARGRGIPDEDIASYLQERGLLSSEPLSNLATRRAFEAGADILPTEDVAPVEEVGLLSGGAKLATESVRESVGGPLVGLAEKVGLAEPGSQRAIREKFETERERFLATDPGPLRATIAGFLEAGAQALPIAPGGTIGRAAVTKLGLRGAPARIAAGGIAGATEGAVVAAGNTLGTPEERRKVGVVQTLGAGALGALGGARATRHIVADPDTRKFQQEVFRSTKPRRSTLTVPERIAKLTSDWFNSLAPVEKVGRRVGGVFSKEMEIAAQWVRTAQSTARSGVFDRTRTLDGIDTGEGLMPILRDSEVAAERLRLGPEEFSQDLQHYMVSQRHLELSSTPREREVTIDPAMTKRARERLDKLRLKYGDAGDETVQVLEPLARRLRDWSVRAHLDPLVEVGVLSRDEYARILSKNDAFAPFERAIDEAVERGVDLSLGTPIKGKFISEGLSMEPGRKLEDVLPVMADRAMRIHVFAEHQRLRNLLVDAAKRDPEVAREIRKLPTGAKGETFSRWVDGKRERWEAPQDVLDALDSMTPKQANAALRFLKPFTQVFRAGSTLALEFGVRNVLRDPLTLGVYSKNGAIPFISSTRAIVESVLDLRQGRQFWREFQASPASHATFLSPDRWDLKRELSIAREISRISGPRRVAREFVKNPLYPFQVFADALEKFSRFAEFSRARKLGKSIGEAGLDAADVTINFPRAGRLGRQWNMAEAFSNAALQDISKFGRAMKERPVPTVLKGIAYLTVPTLYSHYKNQDDPDYQALPEWEKMLFLHPWKLPNGHFVRLPKPPGLLNLIFSYLPQKAIQFVEGSDRHAVRRALEGIVAETPLRFTPLSGIGDGEPLDFVIDLMPNAIQPFVELAANRVPFFDRPVVSRKFTEGNVPPALRATEQTSSPARGLGQTAVGEFLGGPVVIDHFIRSYLGSLGRAGAEALSPDSDRTLLRRDVPKWARPIPLVRSFIGAVTSVSPVGFGSQPVRDIYALAEDIAMAEKGSKLQGESGGVKAAKEYLDNHPEGRYGDDARFVLGQLKLMAEGRQAILLSKRLDPEVKDERLLQIDHMITQLAVNGLDIIHAGIERDLRTLYEGSEKLTALGGLQ